MGTTRSGGTATPATRYLYMSACCSSSSYCAGVNGTGLAAHLAPTGASSAGPPPPLALHRAAKKHATTSAPTKNQQKSEQHHAIKGRTE